MDLNPTAEDRAFRTEVRRWLETNVPTGDAKTLDERKAWHRKLYEAGYVGMLWPKEYGGWGRTPMQQAIVQDEMARLGAPPPINGLGIGFIGPTIIVHGTDGKAAKHKGISCVLLHMRQPGVEVRPLRQITGSSLFSEVFMTDARAERRDLIGNLNQGWEIAQTTLGWERGANSLGRVTRYAVAFNQLVRATKELRRGGKPLLEDAAVRARLGKAYAELEVQRYAALRVLSALQNSDSPGAASSITKLSYTEFEKRYFELALEILGPYGQLVSAREEFEDIDTSSGEPGTWATAFLWSRAGTIYSGSSEIQKNIIGERVLGLPKEVRADRLKA